MKITDYKLQITNVASPLSDEAIKALRAGESVLLSGTIYTARDAAHKRIAEMLERGEPLPLVIRGQTVYYAGPCPAPPGRAVGSIGPTTSKRMDSYAPRLIQEGLRVMIGKGARSKAVTDAMRKYPGVYFAAIGGAGALLSLCVERAELIAFPDLGTEAVYKLTVRNMPLTVAVDCRGGSIYQDIITV